MHTIDLNGEDEVGELEFHLHPREMTELSIAIPKDVLPSLQSVAEERQMPLDALLRQYVGCGLREDLARLYGDRILGAVERVLARHLESKERVEEIIHDLNAESGGMVASWVRDPR